MLVYKAVGVVTVILLSGISGMTLGDQTEVSDFERRAKGLGDTISSDNSKESARCQELHQEVEQLRGKPQRRYTARDAYELECQRSYEDPGRPSLLYNDGLLND